MIERLRQLLLGPARNVRDPHVHHQMALIAFFAWVGLGSDGLSSSAYGPEEAFLALGHHTHLALYLAVAIVLTVFLISASYSQIIELFPSGGGGYLVATRLLNPALGVVSGSALVVDYILTVATSVASGCDAIYSFLPVAWAPWKLPAEFVVITGLVLLNLRGVRESVGILMPIFVAFVLTHVGLIAASVFAHGTALPHMLGDTLADTHSAVGELGLVGVLAILLRAFSLGGGTFTGIEAVSNGVQILREPRVRTAQKTMLYMATSLSFTAGGILVGYLLWNVHHEAGRTLNATLWTAVAGHWKLFGWPVGGPLVVFTLVSEGALLFLAAQTGFIDGPRTMSVMAVDRWLPSRFALLSERLVTMNGVVLMGLATAATLVYTHGQVSTLIVMYSINVFVTFTLSQAGMVRHWWQVRAKEGHWRRRLALSVVGTAVTALILVVTSVAKFREGGWITLVVTGVLVGVCFLVRRHYDSVRGALAHLDETLGTLPLPDVTKEIPLALEGPTAVILVERFNGLGVHTLLSVLRLFPGMFKNVVFVSVGLIDSGHFKGADAVHALEQSHREDLARYVDMATRLGLYAEFRLGLGIDLVDELEEICRDLVKEFRRVTVFTGQLVFERESLVSRMLHRETAFAIQRRLQFGGFQVVILPIRVWEPGRAA